MTNLPPKRTISTLDYERLELLLQHLPAPHSQYQALTDELAKATFVEPAEMPPDVVTMNSSIRLKLNGNDSIHLLTLVYPKDLQSNAQQLSVLAPVGMAILGRRQGDLIHCTNEGTAGHIELIELISQPEREGIFYR
jgi:regulator of nucleoside diphosphate kinase